MCPVAVVVKVEEQRWVAGRAAAGPQCCGAHRGFGRGWVRGQERGQERDRGQDQGQGQDRGLGASQGGVEDFGV